MLNVIGKRTDEQELTALGDSMELYDDDNRHVLPRSTGRGGFNDADSTASSSDGISWVQVSWLMLSDIVGTSVLTFAGVSAKLGWVLTTIFIVGLFPLAVYVSTLMTKTRHILVSELPSAQAVTRVESMGAVATCAFQKDSAGTLVYSVVYGYTLLGQASYLLVLGTTLQGVFYTQHVCLYTAIGVGCVIVLIPLILLRQLSESVVICMINTIVIAVVVITALFDIGVQYSESSETIQMLAFAPGLSLMSVMGQATNVVYSYSGQWMYFELMEAMAVPNDFPRVFRVTGPLMVGTYLVVALLSLRFGVGAGDITVAMSRGPWFRFASILLFLHVLVVYVLKSVVLQRYFHSVCSPSDLEFRTNASYFKHGGLGAAMLMFGYFLSNAIPFFSQLLGLIGGFCAGPINFILPIVLYLVASGRQIKESSPQRSSNDASSKTCASTWSLSLLALRSMPVWEVAVILFIVLFILLTMFVGVADVILQIIDLEGKFGAPFDCHALTT